MKQPSPAKSLERDGEIRQGTEHAHLIFFGMSVQFGAHPQKEWFLSFYELEEEWIVGGYSGAGVDD